MADNTYYVDGKDVTDICDAIRYKGGAEGTILWPDIPAAILRIPTGGSGDGLIIEHANYIADVIEVIETGTPANNDPNHYIGLSTLDIRWGDYQTTPYLWGHDSEGHEIWYDKNKWAGPAGDCVPDQYFGKLGCYFYGLIPDTAPPGEQKPPPAPMIRGETIGIKGLTAGTDIAGYLELKRVDQDHTEVVCRLNKGYFLKEGLYIYTDGQNLWSQVYHGEYYHDDLEIYKFI